MSYPPPSYPGYPPAAPAYPAGYDPRAAPYGYPPPADPAAAPQAPPADPYAAYAAAYPPPQPQAAQPAPAAPQTAPAAQPPQAAGPAPAAPAPDPYAQAHYDYYRQYYAHYPPPQPGYPPAPTDPHQSQQAPPAAHPAPQAHAAPPAYPPAPAQTPPAHGAPPAQPEYPAAYPPPAYPGYPGYDPSRPPDPYAHYAHYPPPGYPGYPHPPPGYPPAPYAYPPPTAPHAHPPHVPPAAPPDRDRDRRPPSPRRDRKRPAPDKRPEKKQKLEPDSRAKLYQHAQQKGWSLFWLEGIDPPTRAMSNSNVTMLILTKGASGPASSFGFLMAASRQPQKMKDRQRECMKDLLVQVEQLLAGKSEADLRSWCQVHESQNGDSESQESDLEKLKSTVGSRLTATGSKSTRVDLRMPSPSSCVIVRASFFEETESKEEAKEKELPDLAAMNFFSADAAVQLEEAHKLGGLLRLQWHLAVVKATNSKDDSNQRPLALGIGLATDEALAKARALRAAEVRAEVLTEAMFLKTQK